MNTQGSFYTLCTLQDWYFAFIESRHQFQNISKQFSGKNHIFWHNSGPVATITQPTKNLLGRYTAGYISDNNSRLIFSDVKN